MKPYLERNLGVSLITADTGLFNVEELQVEERKPCALGTNAMDRMCRVKVL